MSASPLNPAPLDPSLRFAAVPYKAEGGYTVPGLLLTLGLCLAGGVLSGALAGWIGQWYYLIFVFPLGMGAAAGAAGAAGAMVGKLRNPLLASLAGVAGACAAIAAMHAVEFWMFLAEAQKIAPNAANVRFSFDAFCKYIDLSATVGVQLFGRGGKDGMNLGYYGSYIYWIVELVVVALMAAGIIWWKAARPFCTACNTWKTERPLGRVNVPRNVALEAITSGEIIRLAGHGVSPGPGRLSVEAAVCSHCGAAAPVDITFAEITVDEKGNDKREELAHVTYPGQALQVLEELFTAAPQAPAVAQTVAPAQLDLSQAIPLRPLKPEDPEDTWALAIEGDTAFLLDPTDAVLATIPIAEAKERLVFPSFWESVAEFGIQTDDGTVAWFKPDKPAIQEIKKRLGM